MKVRVGSLYLFSIIILVAMNVGLLTFGEYAAESFPEVTAFVGLFLAMTCWLSGRTYKKIYPLMKNLQIWIAILYIYLFMNVLICSLLYNISIEYGIKNIYIFLWLLMIYPLSYVILSENGMKKMTVTIIALALLGLILKSIVWYLYNFRGLDVMHYLLYEFGSVWRKNGIQRIPGSCFTGFLLGWALYHIFDTRRKFGRLLAVAVIAFLIWYGNFVFQSRVQLISIGITLIIVLLATHNTFIVRMLSYVAFGLGIILLVRSEFFLSLLSSLSDNSVSHRFMEIPYYYNLFRENWLLGIAFRSDRISYIRGAFNNFYLSDVGILAELFQYGILGFIICLYPFYRMATISWQAWKRKSPYAVFVLTVTIYTAISSALSNDIYANRFLFGFPVLLVYCENINMKMAAEKGTIQ